MLRSDFDLLSRLELRTVTSRECKNYISDRKARTQKTSNVFFEKMSLFSMTKECKK